MLVYGHGYFQFDSIWTLGDVGTQHQEFKAYVKNTIEKKNQNHGKYDILNSVEFGSFYFMSLCRMH